MKFELGINTFVFTRGGTYAVRRPKEIIQVTDRTADGTLQVEDLGADIVISRREILVEAAPQRDFIELRNWFINVAVGAKNVFTFTDELGCVGDVRWIDTEFDLEEISLRQFSGTLLLEYV